MKAAIKISIAVNVGLAVAVVWLGWQVKTGVRGTDTTRSSNLGDGITAADRQPVITTARRLPEEGFDWSRLESTNYRVYMANLEAIGCPAQTIRDIIVADVDSLYAPRRDALTGKPAAATELDTLNREEASVLASLLGLRPALEQEATESAAAPARTQRPASQNAVFPRPVSMPVVYQAVDPASLNLTPAQQEVVSGLRQQFMEQIGGTNQDPGDPAYRARWDQAQKVADDTLRGLLGSQVYLNYRLHAANAISSK